MCTGLAAGAVEEAALELAPDEPTPALAEPFDPVFVTVRWAGDVLEEHALTSSATAASRPSTRRLDREIEGLSTPPR
jgi:hypothetical protein